MKKAILKPFILVGLLLAATCAALAYSQQNQPIDPIPSPATPSGELISFTGKLTNEKVMVGGDGGFSIALTMTAADLPADGPAVMQNVDMVIVLDRSGSMEGDKITYAKQAINRLLGQLTPNDRFALVSYSNMVFRHSNLLKATPSNLQLVNSKVHELLAGGGTNLGAGLQDGISILMNSDPVGNIGKLILISDGLANQGVTDPSALGRMASTAAVKEFSISTAGVGQDFNEQLMTVIADNGGGRYYYLENPNTFAQVFSSEYQSARTAAATSMEIHVPLAEGVKVVDAAGYPITVDDSTAVIRPGDLRSGQTRTIYLTLNVPTVEEAEYTLKGIKALYKSNGEPKTASIDKPFKIACVKDKKMVYASYSKPEWEKKVIQEDYNKLREEVARDVKMGKKQEAMKKIDDYRTQQQEINAVLGSSVVTQNVEQDLVDLKDQVNESFEGSADEIRQKTKATAKEMQHKGYGFRRSLQ